MHPIQSIKDGPLNLLSPALRALRRSSLPFLTLIFGFSWSCQTRTAGTSETHSIHVNQGVRAEQENWLRSTVATTQISKFRNLVIFGDSLSDPGNLNKRTLGFYLPPKIFYKSRFSNGPIWADYVQGVLVDWEVKNFAVGGAKTSDESLTSRFFVPSLIQQVDAFSRSERPEPVSTVVAIWIGPNNYLGRPEMIQDEKGAPDPKKLTTYVASVMKDIRSAVLHLQSFGYKNFLIGTMPELGVVNQNPREPRLATSDALFAATAIHNQNLGTLIAELRSDRSVDATAVNTFHAGEINQKTIENPSDWGFSHLDKPCFEGSVRGQFYGEEKFCDDPSGYKFWEYIHPNTKMHCYYASQFLNNLGDQGIVPNFPFENAIAKCKQL